MSLRSHHLSAQNLPVALIASQHSLSTGISASCASQGPLIFMLHPQHLASSTMASSLLPQHVKLISDTQSSHFKVALPGMLLQISPCFTTLIHSGHKPFFLRNSDLQMVLACHYMTFTLLYFPSQHLLSPKILYNCSFIYHPSPLTRM